MKFNFKKIASVLAATIMLGSTVSFAAAAWPAPFVQDGSSAAAVVYGANAPSTGADKAAAINLGTELDKSITSVTSSGTTTGDVLKLEKSTNKFDLGDTTNSFYSSLSNEELSKVLASGVYTNDANNEYDYDQSIVLGALQLKHFVNSDFNDNKPLIGFNLVSGQEILNYTLEFTPDAAENTYTFGTTTTGQSDDLETSLLPMLGMTYYIQKVESTATGVKMTLLDNANDASVNEGEDKVVTVGDNSYNVKINFIDTDNTILEINGVKTNKLSEGGVFKIGTDSYVAVKNILYNAKESGISSVEFSIGSGKITLDNGKEVQLNGEDISTSTNQILNAYITNDTSHSITKIKLQWVLDDDTLFAPGSDLVLPGFETIKISMAGFNSPKAEKTTLKADGDSKFTLWTTIKDGDLKLPLLYNNATSIEGLGEKATHVLVSSNKTQANATITSAASGVPLTVSLSEVNNSYFVASWINGKDFETYAYELESITDDTGKNSTVLKNMAGGSDITFSEVGKDKDRGNINFKLAAASDNGKTADVELKVSSGSVYVNKLVTKEGMMITLPTAINATGIAAVADNGELNLANLASVTSWTTNVSEEDKDGNILTGGKGFLVASSVTTDGIEPLTLTKDLTNAQTYETSDGSNIYEGYVQSPLATKVIWDKPTSGTNTLEITYAGEESTADVYIAEASAAVGAVKDSVKVVTDAEVDSVKSKNLIVVGGSCINTVAAKMLGSETAICGDAWASKTGAGLNKYLIQVAASPVNAEKIAMLIAGYESVDTQNAVAKVIEGGVSMEVGTKIVGPKAA